MTELHERFAEGLFEEKSEKLKLHRGENKQGRRTEEQESEADKINQIRICSSRFFGKPDRTRDITP